MFMKIQVLLLLLEVLILWSNILSMFKKKNLRNFLLKAGFLFDSLCIQLFCNAKCLKNGMIICLPISESKSVVTYTQSLNLFDKLAYYENAFS